MAQLAGKGGSIAFGASNLALREWTLDMRVDPIDVTNFDSAGFKENIAGLTSAAISARGPYNQGSMAVTAGSSYAFNLRVNSTTGFAVTARVTSVRLVTGADNAVQVDISAESTGSFTAAIT